MSGADNKTYPINSPPENKIYNFNAIKDQIYDSLYSENYDFIQKIEQTSKTSIKNILIILNGDSGNVFHSLTISQHEYEYQLLIVFDKITKILNDKKILKVLLNTKDQIGNTPFYYFVYYDCDKIIEYFLNINEKIFDNCISILNENGKSPIDAYLDKDYEFLQKLKNNRENYVFNIENGVSILDLKNLINQTFDTNEKILISLLYFYFLDLEEKNKDEKEEIKNKIKETLGYISLIYKKEFDLGYDKNIKNEEYNSQKFKNLKLDINNKIAYCYSNLINEYNKNASTSKIPQLANNSLEYVIIEYTTSLSNNTKTTKDGQYSTVGIEVCNLDGSSLINENNDYIIRKFTLENSVGLQSNDSGSTKIVLTLPKALTEFVVKLGDNRNNMASFRVS